MSTVWREAKAKDGRPYYYNTQTKETRWDRPPEMEEPTSHTPAVNGTSGANPWREVTHEDTGRKYYYHVETKQTTWDMPEAFRQAQAQPSGLPAKTAGPSFVAGGATNNFQPPYQRDQRDERRPTDRSDRGFDQQRYHQGDGYRPSAISNDSQFMSQEEAQAAFTKVLKRVGVQPEWSWDQTMKAAIHDPQYRALQDPKERRAAFEKYIIETREQDKQRAKERVTKLREDFAKMLESHAEIKHYTRWNSARPIIEGETIFRSASDDTERKQLFEEYIAGLKRAHAASEAASRKEARNSLSGLLKTLSLEAYTRWSDAKKLIRNNETFQDDDKFKTLTPSDVFIAFQDRVKELEHSFNDQRQKEKTKKLRNERQNRDQFISLMRELRSAGNIRAGTKWKDIEETIRADPRYDAMLGQPGSTPLDLFWDAVEDEEREYRTKRYEVLDVLDDQGFELTVQSSLEEFASVIKRDPRTAELPEADVTLIYNRLHEKVLQREKEDRAHAERHTRRTIDALRSRIKHLHPPVGIDDSWENVRPRLEKYEEYRALETDEQRKTAFDKVIRRLREKEADAEAEERDRQLRRAEREREVRFSRYERTGRYSRSPEPDAYEADRKKAQAARERQYRKASGTGLSPPRHRDDRYDRYHRHDRERERDRGGYHDFDREYRDRERTYRSRLSDAAGELDYGDGGKAGASINSSNGRRRRESEEDSETGRKESKRLRTSSKHSGKSNDEDTEMKELREEAEKKAKEEENLKSGSEEGEIEEV